MIKIIQHTKNPLSFIGQVAGTCTNVNNENQFKNIALDCIKSNHGRVLEYADIVIEIQNYSARMIRELYTGIIGVSRIQQSTRYVKEDNFIYYIPDTIKHNKEKSKVYIEGMKNIQLTYNKLLEQGLSKEDAANILPLGMMTKVVLKINLRALIHLFHERSCMRAYKEFRDFMTELKYEIGKLDSEWNTLTKYMIPKCEEQGYCKESRSCGKYPNKL